MTDTSRESAMSTDSVVVGHDRSDRRTRGRHWPPPAKGEKARSLGSDAWDELRRRPMFWISAALIVLFVVMAALPQLFTSTDPYYADLAKAREAPSADAWFGRDGQGYDVYARTIYGARASILVGCSPRLFTLVLGSFVGIIAGYRGWLGRLAASAGSARSSSAFRCCSAGSCSSTSFPSDLETPFIVVVGKVALVLGLLGWPIDHAPDALQRAAGQTERLRPGGARARRLAEPDHHLAHPAQLAGLGHRGLDHQPRGLHLGRGHVVVPGHRAAAAGHLVGDRHLRGLRHRPDPGRARTC